MPLPFFYTEPVAAAQNIVVLNEENSKHAVQVLRMQNGEQLKLTDGLGNLYTAEIADAHKKKCTVNILERIFEEAPATRVSIAVSPVKNNSRFEWFLEKATEIGVTEIIPLLCSRTEKQHFRYDRMNGILISALLQSQQVWLPKLHEPVKYEKYLQSLENKAAQKFIAHCEEDKKTSLRDLLSTNQPINQSTILIGPEGDFTKEEIALALQNNFTPVALGDTRLRTETAALVAATLLCVR
jgi:16S rRNA (uracil1498-N3)-methyltransferase